MTVETINKLIQDSNVSKSLISDGYHTFGELYEHRIELFLTICRIGYDLRRLFPNKDAFPPVWRSKNHSDGTSFEGWFIAGMWKEKGKQITYHLPMSKWDNTAFMETLDQAPEWDGHTAANVLERLKQL